MAKLRQTKSLQSLHQDAIVKFGEIQAAVRDERYQCLSDRRFVDIAGAMWEGPYQLMFDNKPRMEVNKLALAVQRIISEYRNNRITTYFSPANGTKDKISDVIEGLYRADEFDSQSQEARDNAFEEAVKGGFGAYRLTNEYEDEYDEDNDYQRIRFKPIFDADNCVFFDLDAKRRDKSDAKYCYVLSGMTKDAYTEEWGETNFSTWPHNVFSNYFDWVTVDLVYIAEYYVVEEISKTVYTFTSLDGQTRKIDEDEFEEDEPEEGEEPKPSLLEQLTATGWAQTGEKRVKCRKVHKYILSGEKILKDCGYIAGTCIPIVPVFGRRSFIDGIERMKGLIRDAKDAQRLKNMQLSSLAELAVKSPVEKPVFTPEQMAGHAQQWADDPIKDYPYLLVNQLTDAAGTPVAIGPVAYTKPPQVAPAMAALLQITEQDMSDILGNQEAGEEIQSNISGRAVELIQAKLDMQAFIYMDNLAVAVRRDAEIWLSMAKELYIEEGRVMKTIAEENQATDSVTLMQPNQDDEGNVKYENDLSNVKMDVRTEVGPSSQSKRSSVVRSLSHVMAMTQDPSTQQVLLGTILMNMQGDGMGDIRDYFRSQLVQLGAVKPTDEEKKELAAAQANQQPDPQSMFLIAEAKKSAALETKAKAETVKTLTAADLDRANTAKTYAGIGLDQQSMEIEHLNSLREFAEIDQSGQGAQ